MKLLSTQENIYSLEVETGDEINIVFQPSEDMRIHLLNIGSIDLPNDDMALSFVFNNDLLYKNKPLAGSTPIIIAGKNYGTDRLEFILSKEPPRRHLILQKINLSKILSVKFSE